jgi:hypothetical protein
MKLLIVLACIGAFMGAISEVDLEISLAKNHPEYRIIAHLMGVILALSYVILITYSLNKVFE